MFLCLPVYWHSLLAVVKSNWYFKYHDIRRRVFAHIVNYYGAYCMLISKPEMSNCYIIMLVTCYIDTALKYIPISFFYKYYL